MTPTSSRTAKLDLLLAIPDASRRDQVLHAAASRGMICQAVASSSDGMKALQNGFYSVVVIDLRIARSHCFSAVEALLQEALVAGARIILLADAEQTLDAVKLVTKGASGFLPTPLNLDALMLQVNFCLQQSHACSEISRNSGQLEDRVVAQEIELQQMHADVMELLSTASCYRDHETGTHNQRVGMVSALLAKTVGWGDCDAENLQLAALMHDIGKLAIPDVILRKPGKLTDDEYAIMQRHTVLGDEMLAKSQLPLLGLSRQIALSHHERWDGNGYPHRLAGDSIPEAARIVSIADVYDALTHDRIYRPAMSEEKALRIMKEGRGTQFDPDLFDAFCEIHELAAHVNATVLEHPSELNSAMWSSLNVTQAV